ncbi:peptide/nickel transport system permease protein [Rhizobium sp. PP-F2F-G36]|nr:peptide/nickel transport system permease protein [Rhizobium sp. PP-F2F-G36]
MYVLKRTGQSILVLAGVVTLIFFVLRLVPGDPISVIAPTASVAVKAELRISLGLDLPLWQQYVVFLQNVVRGDFGQSYFFQGRAIDLVMTALPYTTALAGAAILIALLVAVPAGIAAALHADRTVDRVVLGASLIFQSMPNFWLALLMLSVVAVKSGLFPTVGYVGPLSLVLPAVTLSISLIAVLTQVLRNALVECLRSDMATAMRARGIALSRILLVHGMRLSAVPLLTVIGVQLGYLLGGAVVIEYIFNFPGLGLLTLNAVLRRDYPLLQLVVLVTALIFLVINLLIDLSYGLIDGRLATRRRASPSSGKPRDAT